MGENALIQVIGLGLGGWETLGKPQQQLIDGARWIAGGDRHLALLPQYRHKALPLQTFSQDLPALKHHWQSLNSGEWLVVLASGDPLFFGIGRLLLQTFDPAVLQFHPQPSAVQLAFSRLKKPWQEVQVISVHGRSPDNLREPIKQGLTPLAVLTDPQTPPPAIARYVLDLGSGYDVWVGENLGSPDERVQQFTLTALAALPPDSFAPLNVVILERQTPHPSPLDLAALPLLGIPDHYFFSFGDRPGMITKQPLRVQILAALALQPHQCLWDIGSGTGSVAIEAARLCPTSTIYAIEKTAAGQTLIRQNQARFQVPNLQVISGSAPQCLTALPPPDRIFIGGSGGQLLPILDTCAQALNPTGHLTLAIASLEHLTQALTWCQTHQWRPVLQQIHISQAIAFADLTRFHPLNPLYLFQAFPPSPTSPQ